MKYSFDLTEKLIIIPTQIYGPQGDIIVNLALDTGATSSIINWDIAIIIGYDPAVVNDRLQITTGSGIEYSPIIQVKKIKALGKERKNLKLLCHTLPSSATVDGLLGLDFFKNQRFIIDMKQGIIEI